MIPPSAAVLVPGALAVCVLGVLAYYVLKTDSGRTRDLERRVEELEAELEREDDER
jgi:hypothetical protein